ncbi:hypothetical protein [Parvicella tangerina]|uniref:Outer membrane protein beta-barrel domain-containing protein n=1 Tax=Parvicella tangerina TaxID=2829795 RepID=A0A916JQS7_9FLAO|nr:hypothetical protein [Parvicella tangerina]CAG5087825.1 hypothetical protein CRYO30217_03591 [Parvicella tangerina]
MKSILLVLLILAFSFAGNAQLSTVTGGNFGFSASGGLIMNKPFGSGLGANFGVTTSLYELFFPEISLGYSSSTYGVDTLGENQQNKSTFLGLGLNNKVPLFSLAMGKSKHQECWYLNLKLLLDYHYRFNLGSQSNFPFKAANESGLNLGIGIRPSFSGADKSRVAWAFFYDVFYHLDLNKTDQPSMGTSIQQNGLFFRLTVLHYKTSNMLGGGSKKKAYKRNY